MYAHAHTHAHAQTHTHPSVMLEEIYFKYMGEYHYVTKGCVCSQGRSARNELLCLSITDEPVRERR